MAGIVRLRRIEGSPDDRCERFMKCLQDRVKYGPPEHREPGEAERMQVDVSNSSQEVEVNVDDYQDAKREVENAAETCEPAWNELYEIPPTG
jgi:hypothetical protein